MNAIEKKFLNGFKNYLKNNSQILLHEMTLSKVTVPFYINVFEEYEDAVEFSLSKNLSKKDLSKQFWTLHYTGDEEYIDGYKPDFVLKYLNYRVAIEIDGHDYHEKTKEQASYDKKKDRCYIKNGFLPFHFTGSDIYHSCEEKCEELLKSAFSFFHITGEDMIIKYESTEYEYKKLQSEFNDLFNYTDRMLSDSKLVFENTELSWAEKSILLLLITKLKAKLSVPYRNCSIDDSIPHYETLFSKGYFIKIEDDKYKFGPKFFEMIGINKEEDK